MVIKTETCAFTSYRIWPGHGLSYVPVISVQTTRPVFHFVSSRALQQFLQRTNPRNVPWTIAYRKAHKKGSEEQNRKIKRRRKVKVERGYVGASLEAIKAKQQEDAAQRQKLREEFAKKKPTAAAAAKPAAAKPTQQKTAGKGQQPTRQAAAKPAGGKRY